MFIAWRGFIPVAPSGAALDITGMPLLTELGSIVHRTAKNIAPLTERGNLYR